MPDSPSQVYEHCYSSSLLTLHTHTLVSLGFHLLSSSFFKASEVPHIPAGGQGQALDARCHQLAVQAPSSLVTKPGGTGLPEAQDLADHHH